MPFMKGAFPVRRTIDYLNAGKLILRDKLKIFSVNYNTHGEHHAGAKDFVFWHVPQIQYKNPYIQVVTFKNLTPTPFIRCYYEDGKEILIDVDSRSRQEIMDHLLKVVGKPQQQLQEEAIRAQKQDNPANFGYGCKKHCICEIDDQIPCPGVVPLPYHMRGKYRYQFRQKNV